MPVYTYRCENCGHQFDKHQGFNDEPLKVCPTCRKNALHKVYFPAGVSFKGSGFYVTDKRNGSSAKASPAKGKENGAKDATKEPSSEKKPDAKPETSGEKATPVAKEN